jgi:hypothetical protein
VKLLPSKEQKMNELPRNPFQARNIPLSPDTRQLVEDFIERMEAIQAEQTQALLIVATEAAVKKAEEEEPREHRFRFMFSPLVGWIVTRLSFRLRQAQPPEPEEGTTEIIDAPYRVIDSKE